MKPFPVYGISHLTRRNLLKSMAAAGVVAALPKPLFGQTAAAAGSQGCAAVLKYLSTLVRPDGGYAFADQADSHLTPTFGAIGCFRLLNQVPPAKEKLIDYVRTHHPRELKRLEQERRVFEFQQVQALVWLDADVTSFREPIKAWSKPLAYLKQYEQHGYPIFQSELGAVWCHALLGLPVAEITPIYTDYIESRRRANGSFNNTLTADGGDGHVMNTLWGLQALRVLGRPDEKKDELIAWLRACQLPGGGFTFQPKPMFGGVDDVGYTRAALRALKLLGATPANRDGCIAWICSLANADGGFSDRPGWFSNPTATYYALDALEALGALDALSALHRRAARTPTKIPANLKIFSVQIEAHGHGSPADAVEMARALRIDLWGAKNATPEWLGRVRALAAARKVPVKFFTADEEYGTWVDVPGLGTYSHTSDIIGPPLGDIGASLANKGVVSWPEFRERRLAPLINGSGRLVWQFGENEELVRMYLDDSVERGGYAAISTFHFGNPDFTNTEPFLNRWRGQIPYIGLQDAHGAEPWFFADQTTGYRTLFLATEPTWEEWLNALKQNWVVAVRRDTVSSQKTWMHGGTPEVVSFVREREREWRWWDNPAIARPMLSLVALTPEDRLEVARPERGVALRVRCAWENTPQGLLKQPISEFVRLLLDGNEVPATLVTKKAARGELNADHYHHFHLEAPSPGRHTATAVVRVLAKKEDVSSAVEFMV